MTTIDELIDFDPEPLRERYARERQKRLRPDGSDQYLEVSGDFAKYDEQDPYGDPAYTRDPITEDVEVVLVGGGFSGLLASARLMEAGITDFRIIEAGSDFGGTWYWNRYPGAQCDIESYCYLPLLEELDYMPKEKYSFGDEIYEHSQRVGKHYGLYERTRFSTRVRRMTWDEEIARWRIETNWGDDIRAQFVITATGPASRPKLPGIPGIEDFQGHSFHTSRWDYGYTGGDANGGMTGLSDKKVAIIGTGATAVQCVPRVAQYAEHLYVFQRTPSGVGPRGNKQTDPQWWSSLTPGWQRERRENFAALLDGQVLEEDLVQDGWTDIARYIAMLPKDVDRRELGRLLELVDFKKMNEIRDRVDEYVDDPEVAEALKPYYKFLCKRPTFNDEFLPAFNRDNVTLVDVSEAKGVERITPNGVVANGTEYDVDCIIYASGFEITTEFRRRVNFEIIGRDGQSLLDEWTERMRTLHGFSTRGYPNWFFVGYTQNAFSVNMTSMFDEQARHISYIIAETKRRGARSVEPTEDGQEAWYRLIKEVEKTDTYLDDCTPGYYNDEGKGPKRGTGRYPGINPFNHLLEKWRGEGSMDGLELHR